MTMNENDFTKIKRKQNQKIRIRDYLEEIIKTGKVTNCANRSDFRKREAKVSMQKVSDERPTPATTVCCEDSNLSFKEDKVWDEKTNADCETSAVMMQTEPVQNEPLDLSSKRTRLIKSPTSTESLIHKRKTSIEQYLKHYSPALSTNTDSISRAVQTCTTPEPYKLSFQYESMSRPIPYPKPVPLVACFYDLGLVPGYFVPGQPLKVTHVEHGMKIRLRNPRKWKEQNQRLPQSTFTKTSSCVDSDESQPFLLPVPESSQPLSQSYLSSGCQPISSLNPQLATHHMGQPITAFPDTNQPFITSGCNSNSLFTPSTSADGHLYSPSIPDKDQPDINNMGTKFSKLTEAISTSSNQAKSSFISAEEESHMDTGSTTSLPNIPDIFGNVKDWEQPNSKNEKLMKLLQKKINHRLKTPD